MISLVLAVSIAGRLLMGWLADRMPTKVVMLTIYLLVACAIPLLLIAPVAVHDVSLRDDLRPRARRRVPDHSADGGRSCSASRVLGRVMGIVLTADGVAEATAPMLVGYLRDRTGTYNAGFFTLVGAALVGAAAIALLPSRRSSPT